MTERLLIRRIAWLAILTGASVAVAVEPLNATLPLLPSVLLAVAGMAAIAAHALGLRAGSRRVPAAAPGGRDRHLDLAAARHLVERYGEDSISPFIVRPDKSYEFADGGVVAYRVFGRTAVVSGDPVAAVGTAGEVMTSFLRTARSRGWAVVVYGASADHLEIYHRLGFRSLCVGEEAVARPQQFTLEGRRVRKLRQSLHRVRRRGWQITTHDGISIDGEIEDQLRSLEARWRAQHPRLLGFAMSMGPFEGDVGASDLYVLARSPEGDLAAAFRFIMHRGKLSLDTMRRTGETPNGLSETLVCRALEVARERGISEVSLNYAGLAHLVRGRSTGGRVKRSAITVAIALLGRRFQMQRLVRFNEKFSPEWRGRYLIYPSRIALPRAVYRVLQAEGYLSWPSHQRQPEALPLRRARTALAAINTDASGR